MDFEDIVDMKMDGETDTELCMFLQLDPFKDV